MDEFAIFRTTLIDAIEELRQEGPAVAYQVILDLRQYPVRSSEMAAARQIFTEMGVSETDLYQWFGRYITWTSGVHIEIAGSLFGN